MTTWDEALDALEAQLDRAERALAEPGSAPGVGEFTPPAVTGPLPAALATRAESIVQRGDAIRAACEAESARIRAELHKLGRRAPSTPRGAAFFETRA